MKVLILSPHPDDMEYNMGGTVVKMKKENDWPVSQIIFSDCFELKGSQFIDGAKASTARLEINTMFKQYPNQEFISYRAEIREFLFSLVYDYDIIFVPCRQDWHQDHQVVTQEAIRIFRKNSTILGYIKDEIFERHHDLRVDLSTFQVSERLYLMRLFGMNVETRNSEWFEVIQLRNYL